MDLQAQEKRFLQKQWPMKLKPILSALKAQRNLKNTTDAIATNSEKLSSGFRINKSADDAAGLAISDTLNGKIASTQQARRNANDGVSLIQVAEGSMNEITNILIRLRELTTQAASDTLGNLERSYTNLEYTQLVDEYFDGTMTENYAFALSSFLNNTLIQRNQCKDILRMNAESKAKKKE